MNTTGAGCTNTECDAHLANVYLRTWNRRSPSVPTAAQEHVEQLRQLVHAATSYMCTVAPARPDIREALLKIHAKLPQWASSEEAANSTQREALAAVVESIAARKAVEAEQDAAGREGRLQNNSQCPSWNRYVEAQAKVWPALEKWARVQGENSQ